MGGFDLVRKVAARGLEFDVAIGIGGGPPFSDQPPNAVLLHGFPQSNASFHGVAALLNGAGVATYAPNQRGYSSGARPGDVSDYALDHLVDDVVAICDQLDLGTVHLVGHDFGAIVGWSLAARRPDLLESFTAISVPHLSAFGAAIRDDPEQRERSGYMDYFRQADAPEAALLADDAAALRIGYGDAVPQESTEEFLRVLMEPGAMTSALNWYRALPTDYPFLPPTEVPTTFIWGTDDIAVLRSGAQRCGDHVRGPYTYVELAGVSHWVPDEAPQVVATAVLEHVRSTQIS
jgi:pimeloyl-ACP methyl ester carboxylesterase